MGVLEDIEMDVYAYKPIHQMHVVASCEILFT